MIRLAQMTGFLNLAAVQNSERAPLGPLAGFIRRIIGDEERARNFGRSSDCDRRHIGDRSRKPIGALAKSRFI
jgi:hypothetical protein